MRYRCPSCKTVNMLDIKDQGKEISCGRCDEALTVPSDYITPGVVFGDFALKEKAISRSHETDFLAEQISLQRDVILKVISPELCQNQEFVKTFLDAGRSASHLSHPFICQIIGVGKENDIYYLARESGGSQSLRDHLVEKGVLHWKGALKLTYEVAEALDFAWKYNQVRHLNLKPDYILVDTHNHARIADIGMAGLNPEPGSDRIIGTPQYISPERIVGLDGDNRSDLYSLGVTLFFMLTGQFPFKANNTSEYIDKHLNEKPRKASDVFEEIPMVVCDIIGMLLEKNPNERYQSGELLTQDLKAVLRGQAPINLYQTPQPQPSPVVTPAIAADGNPPTLKVTLEPETTPHTVTTEPPKPIVKLERPTPDTDSDESAEVTPIDDVPEVELDEAVEVSPIDDVPEVELDEAVEVSPIDDFPEVDLDEWADVTPIDDLPEVELDEPAEVTPIDVPEVNEDEPAEVTSDETTGDSDEDPVPITFDTHINVDDVFSDFDNLFDELDDELDLSHDDDGEEDSINSEEFNEIIDSLDDDIKTPLPEMPLAGEPIVDEVEDVEPVPQYPKATPAVQPERPIAMAAPVEVDMPFAAPEPQPQQVEVIQIHHEQPIVTGIPTAQVNDPVADEVDALFDEEVPPPAPTSFPAINNAQNPAPEPEPERPQKKKKKKLKGRTKSKINFRRK